MYELLFTCQDLENDTAFQQAVRTSHGRRPPPTAARLATGSKRAVVPPSSMGARPITGAADPAAGAARPMTAVRGAGYTSAAAKGM